MKIKKEIVFKIYVLKFIYNVKIQKLRLKNVIKKIKI